MDIEILKMAFAGGQFAMTSAACIYLYLERKNDTTNTRISKLQTDVDGRLDDNAQRLAHLEARINNAPTHADLSKLYERVNNVAETTGRLEGEMRSQSEMLRLLLSRVAERGMK